MISVITPTCDRPLAFGLCERWMSRQTTQPDEWIIADGGQTPATCTMGQVHLHNQRPPGAENFAHNLLAGIAAARGDVIVFAEDDDWYAPDHLETLVVALEPRYALAAGDDQQRYYNVAHRCWRTFDNVGASLCQTAIRRGAAFLFRSVVADCLARRVYGIDTNFWRAVPRAQWSMTDRMTCLGIKGLPGQAGLGIGHRPTGPGWTADPHGTKLREWIGEDAAVYEGASGYAWVLQPALAR